ncbi:MAG: hypothetical protein JST30_07815 [Armatimonadetes bacterium]|nr:hypothetical protein [Armatimonadota bacterium]
MAASRSYDAFGAVVGSSGTWKGASGFGGFFGYGEEDTGLQHVGHRYYDPSTGRFLTRDPAYDGPNWYAYCLGDPVNSADPSGLLPIETIADIAGIAMDIGDIVQDPGNGWKWLGLGWSIAATVIPYAPGSWVARGAKLVKHGTEAVDSASDATRGGVYLLRNLETGEHYVGRTKNFLMRSKHWEEDPVRGGWSFEKLRETDDYAEQRYWDQFFLEGRDANIKGLGAPGNVNKINGIRGGSTRYADYLK